jgi:hypothetical protein
MNLPQPVSVIGTGLALLAFVIAFYVLLARERKIPYITNFVFPPAALFILATLFGLVSQLLQPPGPQTANPGASLILRIRVTGVAIASFLAITFLSLGMVVTLLHIWRLHNRQVHFRDDHWLKNTRFLRWLRSQWRRLASKATYEHSPIDVEAKEVLEALTLAGFTEVPGDLVDLRTIAICKEPLAATDPKIARLCRELISRDWQVQYTTCIRHPQEFMQVLKAAFQGKWTEAVQNVIVVDAYSPHFGFTDSIHEVKTLQLKRDRINVISARDSYAGVHTANARAFNILKRLNCADRPRKPALLLYEGANALSDLESTEQYRIFARHVLTSERMWGGMLTLFVEPTIGSPELDLLRTYSDFMLPRLEVLSGKPV